MKDSRKLIVSLIFAMADIVAMVVAYVLANKIKFGWYRTGIRNPNTAYITLLLIVLVSYLVLNLFKFGEGEILRRSLFKEGFAVVKLYLCILAITVVFLYFTKTSESYSRGQMGIFFGLSVVFVLIERGFVKKILTKWFNKTGTAEKVVLISTYDRAVEIIERLKRAENWYFRIEGIVILDLKMIGEDIGGVEVIADRYSMIDTVSSAEIDTVFICLDKRYERFLPENSVKELIQLFCNIGKKVHVGIDEYGLVDEFQNTEMIGDFAVTSYQKVNHPLYYRFIKRTFDIIVGFVGVMICLIVYFFAALGNYLEGDSGNVVISYLRIGRNGRRYYQHRFRTMYRKEKVREEKCNYTKTGRILIALHLDGLPQAFNIFWGELSLVGTKSPSLSEFLRYSAGERRSLKLRPGILGYGSNYSTKSIETNDMYYIEECSIWLDIRVLVENIIGVSGKLRKVDLSEEEAGILLAREEEARPLSYINIVPKKSLGRSIYLGIKRGCDIVISGIGLIVLSPLFLIIAAIIKYQDGGNVFYKQYRIGYAGKKIYMYKFRSMHMKIRDLDKILSPEQLEQYRREYKIDDDPRITKFGNFLRASSLDELPQLLNVLRGDLSLIGPRPIVEEELKNFGQDMDSLLSVKPGMTGYWAVMARNNASYESGERQRLELTYVEKQNLCFDIKILFKTVPAVLKRQGAK